MIGNTTDRVQFVDVPLHVGDTSATYTTPNVAGRTLDLLGVQIFAAGATAAQPTVATVALGGEITLSGGAGAAEAAHPSQGVPGSLAGQPGNQKTGTGFYANYSSTGTVQGGITERSGAVPNPAAVTPLKAAIAVNTAVSVDLTGALVPAVTLPEADEDNNVTLPTGNVQAGNLTLATGSLPFTVNTANIDENWAGQVRFVFAVPVGDPNTAAKAAGTYPKNGVQKGIAVLN